MNEDIQDLLYQAVDAILEVESELAEQTEYIRRLEDTVMDLEAELLDLKEPK